MGELQKHAGPDHRTTGTATLLDANPDTRAVDGVAWWVGDEGVKAKVDTTNPYLAPGGTDEEKALHFRDQTKIYF